MCHFVQTLAEVLKVNSTLMILNLESNRITRKGIKVRNIVGVVGVVGVVGKWERGVGVCGRCGWSFVATFVGLICVVCNRNEMFIFPGHFQSSL